MTPDTPAPAGFDGQPFDESAAIPSIPLDKDYLLRITEACAMLGVSRAWIYKSSKRGHIKIVKIGGMSRVKYSALCKILNNGTHEKCAEKPDDSSAELLIKSNNNISEAPNTQQSESAQSRFQPKPAPQYINGVLSHRITR